MSTADTEQTIKGISAVLFQRITVSYRAIRKMYRASTRGDEWDIYGNQFCVFNDGLPPAPGMSVRHLIKGMDTPSAADICLFITTIFTKAQMERDSLIIALIYIERLAKTNDDKFKLGPHNWKTVVFVGLLLASYVIGAR